MNFSKQLDLHTPVLWVSSLEPHRVIEYVCHHAGDRKVVRYDYLEGGIEWSPASRRWLRIMIVTGTNDDGSEIIEPAASLGQTLEYSIENHRIFLFEDAHNDISNFIGFCRKIATDWVFAMREDNLTKIPATIVCIAPNEEKFPIELERYSIRLDLGLPDSQQIEDIITRAERQSSTVTTPSVATAVRALQGLSEAECFNAISDSIKTHGAIQTSTLSKRKIEVISRSGSLEIRQPNITIAEIGGLDLAKDLISTISWIYNNIDEAKKFGIEPIRRVLMVGVPGTGKSAICEAAADALGLDLAIAGVSKVMSKFVGESEQNMRAMFKQISAMKPIVMWIDELGRDLSGSGSSNTTDGGTTDRVHGELLTGLQELPPEVFLIAAANRIDDMPPEMLRADRFDRFMFVGLPSMSERIDIFKIHLHEQESAVMDLDELAVKSVSFTGAEIKALIRDTRFRIIPRYKRPLKTQDLVKAIPNFRGRVWQNYKSSIVEMYRRALNEWDFASSAQYDEAAHVLDAANGRTKNAQWLLANNNLVKTR